MNGNNKPYKVLSDLALERVMRDILSGIWEISSERALQEISKADLPQSDDEAEAEGIYPAP